MLNFYYSRNALAQPDETKCIQLFNVWPEQAWKTAVSGARIGQNLKQKDGMQVYPLQKCVACNGRLCYVTCNRVGRGVMTTVGKRVQKHRSALRKAGLRPVQIWVPDTRRSGFAAECARQSAMLRHDAHEKEIAAFLEKVADCEGWEA